MAFGAPHVGRRSLRRMAIIHTDDPWHAATDFAGAASLTDVPVHSASRVILASPRALFRAFIDPEVVATWRAPLGMSMRIFEFDPRTGGGYRMVLSHDDSQSGGGKSSPTSDVVRGRFIVLEPNERIVEAVEFETDNPAFAGTMTLIATLRPVADGTKVTIEAANVPPGIAAEDHRKEMESSLKRLAILLE